MTDPALTTPQIDQLLRSRRTIHEFLPEAPPVERIREALDAARFAPNHHLSQPWRFHLLGQETIGAIAELNAELITAKKGKEAGLAKQQRWSAIPGWIAVSCLNSQDALRAQEDYAATCCAIYATMLHLWPDGIGCKWTTGAVTREPRIYDLLWMDPDVETLVALLWYGYPAEVPVAQRRALSEVLVELP